MDREFFNTIIDVVVYKVIKKGKLNRDFNPQEIYQIEGEPFILSYNSKLDYQELKKKKYGEALENFSKVLTANFSNEELGLFIKNIQTLKIEKQSPIKNHDYITFYDIINNEIKVICNQQITKLYHELWHMASSTYQNNVGYSGFCQHTIKKSFAVGINEGYTELLNKRYFKKANAYKIEVSIVRKLEKIIGKEKMEYLYLTANLNSLINELSKYRAYNDIINFIVKIDFLNKYLEKSKSSKKVKELNIKALREVNLFLLKAYLTKLIYKYLNNLLTLEEMFEKIKKYYYLIDQKLVILDQEYVVLSSVQIKKIIKQILQQFQIDYNLNKKNSY